VPAEAEADRVRSAVNAKVDRWQKPEIDPIEKKVLLFMKAPEKEAADNFAMDTPKVEDRQRIERMIFVVLTLCSQLPSRLRPKRVSCIQFHFAWCANQPTSSAMSRLAEDYKRYNIPPSWV
jgi:hypothetical protein